MPYIGNPIYQSAFVTDQFSGTGSQTAYTMSVAPAGTSNVLVVVSGVVQDPSTYGVVGNTLTFSAAPPSGTGNISCRYLGVPVTGVTTTAYRTVTEFTATAGQTTFTPPSYSVGFINVYLNGVLLGSADYTATNGTTVVLATGATAGDLLTVESFQISSVANAIQNTAGSVSNSNLSTGSVTPAKLSTGGPYWDTAGNVGLGTTSPFNANGTNIEVANSTVSRLVLNQTGTRKMSLGVGTNAFNIYDETANAERFRINSSGYVTKSYQPMFFAYLDTNQSVGTGPQVVNFNVATTNVASGYNTSTYRFTAPVAGYYQLNANVSITGTAQMEIQVWKNGGSFLGHYGSSNQSAAYGLSISCTYYFAANDYVQVLTYSGATRTYAGRADAFCSFSGYLLG